MATVYSYRLQLVHAVNPYSYHPFIIIIHCNQTSLSSGQLYLCCIYPHDYVLSEVLCAIVMECTLHKDTRQFGS